VTFATPPSNQPFASGSVLRGRRKSAPGFVLISEVSSTLTESAPAIPWPAALYAGRFTVLVATAGNADASSRTTAAATVTARERRKRAGAMAGYYPLLRLELDVLIRRRPGIVGQQAEARLAHARAVAVQERELPDRQVHDLVVHELLNLVEERLALLRVRLAGLLAAETVDICVPFVREHA